MITTDNSTPERFIPTRFRVVSMVVFFVVFSILLSSINLCGTQSRLALFDRESIRDNFSCAISYLSPNA